MDMNTPDTEKCEECEQYGKIRVGSVHKIKAMNCRIKPSDPVFFDPNTPDTEWEKEFVEKGADLEHTRWAKWQAYLHSKCVEHENGKGEWVCFPAELYRRWERQINTPYSELSEQEKESDRKEARSYLPLLASRDTYWKERVRKKFIPWEKIEILDNGAIMTIDNKVRLYGFKRMTDPLMYEYDLRKGNQALDTLLDNLK